jgi:hypothetical protein
MEVPCGARLASKCAPCAEKNRQLRLQQLREGWHLAEEPTVTPRPANGDERALIELRAHYEFERLNAEANSRWDQITDLDDAITEVSEAIAETGLRGTLPTLAPVDSAVDKSGPRKRSTRRRADAGDLPRMKVEARTIGRVITGTDGRTHRDSMLLTITLDSYGAIHSPRRANKPICACGSTHHPDDPKVGTPVDPATYDYRRAALDAIHFARFLDRFWQNLRRACGFKVQYGGCIELQKRLAPHGHFAIRGTLPRALVKRIAAATYHQVWWPPHDELVYSPADPPRWDAEREVWIDPTTKDILPMTPWEEALDTLDVNEGAQPTHVVRCGRVDPRGVKAGSKDAERTIRYITKYLTKDITDHITPVADPQRAHFDRMHAELAVLPCSATCANWLLYGIAPKNTTGKLRPGNCNGKVHQRESLGFTGRRVLISRQWSNKTLTDHRDDNRAWVKALLALGNPDADSAGPNHDEDHQPGAGHLKRRYEYELAKPGDPDLPPERIRIMRAISARIQWRQALDRAKQRQAQQQQAQLSATTPIPLAA